SPVILRLAEMYLIRAEANAKSGSTQLALDDVNLIRKRAGLTGTAQYTLADLKGRGTVLNVVLEEKRLEFFLEGHRYFDLYRNNLPMIRAYIGFHGTDHFNFTVLPNNPRVIYFIPEDETIVNPNLVQNP
ncbi:MAG: RagB/SusD family nutrient uptake outer membrane protein, partial [Chitinophagaceae bacterium]